MTPTVLSAGKPSSSEIAGRVAGKRFTAVFGPSGSGKSSLLRAGVIPALTANGTEVRLLTPGSHPLAELGDAPAGAVLVVDQFEEVFTLCRDARERDDFISALLDTPDHGSCSASAPTSTRTAPRTRGWPRR